MYEGDSTLIPADRNEHTLPDVQRRGCSCFARLIAPGGQITDSVSSPFCKNIPVPFRGKSPAYLSPSRPTTEGRFAIVTDVGRGDAMDAGGALTKALIPADGEVVWS
jgi:hypothetical protein